MKKKSITLEFTNYIIEGIASVKLWGGGKASIDMKSFSVDDINGITIADLNDNGFGVEAITGAYIYVYRNYEGHKIYDGDLIVGTVFDCVYDNLY